MIRINIYEGIGNLAKFSKFSKSKIGCPFKSLYLEKNPQKTLPYIKFVFKCVAIHFWRQKEMLEKSLNKLILAADSINGGNNFDTVQ